MLSIRGMVARAIQLAGHATAGKRDVRVSRRAKTARVDRRRKSGFLRSGPASAAQRSWTSQGRCHEALRVRHRAGFARGGTKPIGTHRLDEINLLNFRVDETISLKEGQAATLRLNVFNLLNINTVMTIGRLSGPE